jgi:mRNA-degrading endonuclease RelE of RelBE toxin-antitoxin system
LSNKKKIYRTKRFAKDIKKLDIKIQQEAFRISLKLSENIFDDTLKIKHLIGFDKIYRVVVYKDYRLVYTFDEENIYLLRIAHRKNIYKNLEL